MGTGLTIESKIRRLRSLEKMLDVSDLRHLNHSGLCCMYGNKFGSRYDKPDLFEDIPELEAKRQTKKNEFIYWWLPTMNLAFNKIEEVKKGRQFRLDAVRQTIKELEFKRVSGEKFSIPNVSQQRKLLFCQTPDNCQSSYYHQIDNYYCSKCEKTGLE